MPMPRPLGLDRAHARWIVRWMSSINTWVYRKTGGKVGGRFLRGAPVLLLTTVGRKSGLPRTKPLLYMENGDDLVIVASKGGMKSDPLWYLNLMKTPEVTVQIGENIDARLARTASASERDALWPDLLEMYRDFDTYQSWTEREIPVVILEPKL